MTDPTPPGDFDSNEHDDLLAAEYVLGTLPLEERRAAAERADVDVVFATRVRAWEDRFSPLDAQYDTEPAPDLLPQIEERLFGAPDSARPQPARSRFTWPWAALSGVVAAAVVAILVLFLSPAPTPAPMILQADLAAEDAGLQFVARWDAVEGQLELTRTEGEDAAEGQDYELWLIDESGAPRSLGLLRDPVTQLSTVLVPGQTLAISLEPEGGSPEDAPTGPVLAAAALAEV